MRVWLSVRFSDVLEIAASPESIERVHCRFGTSALLTSSFSLCFSSHVLGWLVVFRTLIGWLYVKSSSDISYSRSLLRIIKKGDANYAKKTCLNNNFMTTIQLGCRHGIVTAIIVSSRPSILWRRTMLIRRTRTDPDPIMTILGAPSTALSGLTVKRGAERLFKHAESLQPRFVDYHR